MNERVVTIQKRATGGFLAQSSALATDGMVILPYAGKSGVKRFMQNPLLTIGHPRTDLAGKDMLDAIAGRAAENSFSDEGWDITPEFATTQVGRDAKTLYDEGILRSVSIRWNEDKRETDPAKMDKLLAKWNIALTPDQRANLKAVITDYVPMDVGFVMHGADPKALKRAAEAGNLCARELVGGEPEPEPAPAREPAPELTLASIRAAIREEVTAVLTEIGVQAPEPDPAAAPEPEPESEGPGLYDDVLNMAKATAAAVAPKPLTQNLGELLKTAKQIKKEIENG